MMHSDKRLFFAFHGNSSLFNLFYKDSLVT